MRASIKLELSFTKPEQHHSQAGSLNSADSSFYLSESSGFLDEHSINSANSIPSEELKEDCNVPNTSVKLFTFGKKYRYSSQISKEARRYLASLKGECYVLSVSGNSLLGKTSLLNLFASYLSSRGHKTVKIGKNIRYQNAFQVGDGIRPTTDTIDMFCVSVNNKNFILLDVEGDNNPKESPGSAWAYSNFLTVAKSLSHIHIYNHTGVPQEAFLENFRAISQINKQAKFHPKFNLKTIFLKRDEAFSKLKEFEKRRTQYTKYIRDDLKIKDPDHSYEVLNTPPSHIRDREDEDSCIQTSGIICRECQEDVFFDVFSELLQNMLNLMDESSPYQNSKELLDCLQQIIKKNRKEIPFSKELSTIYQLRWRGLNKSLKKQKRNFRKSRIYQGNTLTRQIQEIKLKHPKLAENEEFENFDRLIQEVVASHSEVEESYKIFQDFIKSHFLSGSQLILDQEEKKNLIKDIIKPFEERNKILLSYFSKYEQDVEIIMNNLIEVQKELNKFLEEYNTTQFKAKTGAALVAGNTLASTAGMVLGHQVIQIISGVVIGGGALGAVFVVASLWSAKRKWEKETLRVAEEYQLTENTVKNAIKVEDQIKKLIKELEQNCKTLKEICSQEVAIHPTLMQNLDELINMKIQGEDITNQEKRLLRNMMDELEVRMSKYREAI